jgi:DNA-binding transcriptional LysR family regulator
VALSPSRLRLLEVFARVGTVRAVADELRLSPSTVSQQLGVLEAETAVTLFERSGRMLTLTPAGRSLAARAGELRDHLESIEAELGELRTGPAGRLRIGGFASSVASLLVPAVHRLAREHPRIEVELLEVEPRDSTAALHRGDCDVIVTVDERDGTLLAPTLAVRALRTDPLLVVLAAAHPLAQAPGQPPGRAPGQPPGSIPVDVRELAGERWALDLPHTYLGELVPRHCREAGFEPRVAGRFSSYGVLLDHVAAGLSVGVLPALAVPPRPGIVARAVAGLEPRRIVAAVRTGTAGRLAIRAALDALAHP